MKWIGRQQAGGWGHWESLVLDQKQGNHNYVAPSHLYVPLKPPRPQPGQRDFLLWSRFLHQSAVRPAVTDRDHCPTGGPPGHVVLSLSLCGLGDEETPQTLQ